MNYMCLVLNKLFHLSRLVVVHFFPGIWTNPRVTGSQQTNENGEIEYFNRGYGSTAFISREKLRTFSFLKGEDLFLFLEVKGEHCFPNILLRIEMI